MKAFITKHNFNLVVNSIDKSIIDINEEIYNIEFRWFSEYEIRELLAFKNLFENPDKFFEKYQKHFNINTKNYVFRTNSPAFHIYDNCKSLNSNFTNVVLPASIAERGNDAVNEFIKWCNNNRPLFTENRVEFIRLCKQKFNFNEELQIDNYENTGRQDMNNWNLTTLEQLLDRTIQEANNFYMKSSKNTEILDIFGKISDFIITRGLRYNYTRYKNDEIFEVVKEFDSHFKTKIKQMLKDYYRVKYNKDLVFESKLLEQLGFKLCYHCKYLLDCDCMIQY